MTDAFVCDGVRTPIGRYTGSLATVRTDDMAALPITQLLKRAPDLDPAAVDDVLFGCANQAGEDNRNVARMAGLLAGLPITAGGITLNRLCASGLDAVNYAARTIKTGEADLLIAGGVESMSRSPFVMPKADSAFSRKAEIFDTTMGWRFINRLLKEQYGVESMPETAENVAARFQVSREDQDAFALRSQQKVAAAQASGFFDSEIMSVEIPVRRADPIIFAADEHPRADTTADKLAALRAPFRENGTVTAGNASGINDGAAALIVASKNAVRDHKLTPLARIVTAASVGVEPAIMGIGPVPATHKALKQAGLTLAQMDVIELNEAFAAQSLAVMRELGLADDAPHVNPNGGAIALGHPLGMSGARLLMTAAYQLRATGGRYALCTLCVGVGQGVATIIERVDG